MYSLDNIYVVTLASLALDTETNVLFSGSIRYSTILSIKAAECAVRSKLSILRKSKIRGETYAAIYCEKWNFRNFPYFKKLS